MSKYGYFVDPDDGRILNPGHPIVTAQWCNDGTRDMILTRWLIYVDPMGEWWVVPPGARINGLSAPRFFWRLVQPFEPRSREASVLHDWCCATGMEWVKAARLFWWAMRANAVRPLWAFIRWACVRYVGGLFQGRHRGCEA